MTEADRIQINDLRDRVKALEDIIKFLYPEVKKIRNNGLLRK